MRALRLTQGTLRRLHEGDAVLGVPARLVERADLGAHPLGDAQSRRIVGGRRDAQTRRQTRKVS